MKSFVFLTSCCLLFLSGCQSADKEPVGLPESVYAYAKKGTLAEQQTALLLLTHVALNDSLEATIAADLKTEQNQIKRLLLSHLLYSRTQETRYATQFVEEFPTGNDLTELYSTLRKTDYIATANPLQATLAQLATTDDKALSKLIAAFAVVDGADAAVLDEQVTALYQLQKERIEKTFNDLKLDIGQVQGIVHLKNIKNE